MPHRFSIGVATVVMLVLLRVNIGWHFFSEGVKHYADPQWTSEPVLRAARGPLAPMYHAYLSDFHGFERLLHGDGAAGDSHPLENWSKTVQQDWDAERQEFGRHFGLSEQQQQQAGQTLDDYKAKLNSWVAANEEAVATHIHQWQRKEAGRHLPSSDMPFQKKRTTEKQGQLTGEANGWSAELKAMERKFEDSLNDLVGDEARMERPFPHRPKSIEAVDVAMTYGILAIGGLLLLGLFTRLACVAGALFLASVVMMQPFWVSDAVPTYNQWVEMFALLTLATTPVGRWAGLDFFLANLFWGSSSTKGKTDVPKT